MQRSIVAPRLRPLGSLCLVEMLVLGSVTAPLFIGLPLKLAVIDLPDGVTPEGALARIAAAGAVVGLVATPLFGWVADRSSQAHRGNWIIGGVVGGALLCPVLMSADSLSAVLLTWSAIQVAYGAAFAGLYGALADCATGDDQVRGAGWFAAAGPAAFVVAFGTMALVPHSPPGLFLVLPATAAVVVLLVRGDLRVPKARGAERDAEPLAVARRAVPQFWVILVQRFLAQTAYQVGTLFGVYVLARRAQLEPDHAATWVSVTIVVAATASLAASLVAGRCADRRSGDLRLIMTVGLTATVVALALKVVAVHPSVYSLTTILLGAGVGAYFAVDLAAVLRVIPAGREGYLLGLFAVARALPQAVAPAVGSVLLGFGSADLVGVDRSQNFAALFAAGAAVAVSALLLVPWLTAAGPRRDAARGPA